MASKHNKAPQKHLTKAGVAQLAKNKEEVARKRTIIVDQFYPALIEATVSVDEAKALISALGSLVMEDTLRTMRERRFVDIKEILIEQLCKDGERKEGITKLLETLKDENLFTAREIIEGMTKAIEAMVTEELRGRKLDTLKTNWEGYLN